MASFIAKTLQGLEPVLAKELRELGANNVEEVSRAVLFDCNQRVLYNANYLCRTAIRILKKIKEFDIEKQDDLYDGVYDIAWEKIFPVDAEMTIAATCIDSVFTNSRFASQRVKDAIVDKFRRVLGQRPNIDNEFYTIRVEVFMRRNHVEVLLDSSGLSLHNRGYRKPNTDSFNEVMAAGLLMLSGWRAGTGNLYMPFCKDGGLLAMEAAMMASRMPAGYFRKGYSFQYWNDYDANLWKELRRRGVEGMCDPEGYIWATDSDGQAVEKTEDFLKRLRMHHDVGVGLFDFFQGGRFEPEEGSCDEDCTLLVYMPYFGEMRTFEAEDFCTQTGNVLKKQYKGCTAWIYTTDVEAVKFVGLKPSAKYNPAELAHDAKFHGFEIK